MLNYSDYSDSNSSETSSLLKNFLNDNNDNESLGEKEEISHYVKKNKNVNNTENKLNHIISLLEQKQDEKTETVFEELILYLFLGFLIIYMLDSFVKVGRYVR